MIPKNQWWGVLPLLFFLFWSWPIIPKEIHWVETILLINILLLAGPAIRMDREYNLPKTWWIFFGIAALSVFLSYLFPKGTVAFAFSLPWLLLSIFLAIYKVEEIQFNASGLLQRSAYLFWIIGAMWTSADRLGFRPLDFSPTLVLLTAVHFHYAGLLLPLFSYQLLKTSSGRLGNWIAWGIMLGIPFVAIGITTTKLGFPIYLETFAANWMACFGFVVGFLHVLQNAWRLRLGGSLLMTGMILALAYAWNPYLGWNWLTIPWMYAFHGTINAVALGFCLLPGWILFLKKA